MIIQSENVYINRELVKAQIEINDSKITGIYEYNSGPVDKDYGKSMILPGFYDIHTHGYKGYDTCDGTPIGLKTWLKEITKEGVCGICPTTVTEDKEVLTKALKNVKEVKEGNPSGAEILGIHFEGPYINKEYKGAQNEKYIVEPNIEEFEQYNKVSDNLIKIVTLAPELDKDFEFIKYCKEHDINASMGHSGTSYDTAIKAIENGARGVTHTYNGMSAFRHRDGGLINASLSNDDVYSEIICDGNHSTLDALKIFFRAKKSDKAIMISDSLMCKGYAPGDKFDFGGQMIEIYPDGSAHLMEGKKNLAGSTLKINKGVQLLVQGVGVAFNIAVDSCTINPMRYLKMDDHKGLIKENYDADIVILNDNYDVVDTYCKGVCQ